MYARLQANCLDAGPNADVLVERLRCVVRPRAAGETPSADDTAFARQLLLMAFTPSGAVHARAFSAPGNPTNVAPPKGASIVQEAWLKNAQSCGGPTVDLRDGLPPGPPRAPADYEDVKRAVLAALHALKRASTYYVLDGFVTEHVQIKQGISMCYKLLIKIEPDANRAIMMH